MGARAARSVESSYTPDLGADPCAPQPLLNRLLCLPNATVRGVDVRDHRVRVGVRPHRRRLRCPYCDFSTRHRYDTRDVDSSWRHLDLGGRVCVLTLRRRRLRCPEHGVHACLST